MAEPSAAWRRATGSLWLRPTLAVGAALVLGVVLSSIDVPEGSVLDPLLFRGEASDARQLLTVVVGTMITVTSLVFALTVVALQIASTQFSPRLLRSFLRDRGTQLVLSTFVGTVAYALAGLQTVGRVGDDGRVFVPEVAVSGALALALVSVGMLVYYIQHVTDSIRIDTIMRGIERTALDVLARDHVPLAQAQAPVLPTPTGPVTVVPAPGSGYLQGLRAGALLRAASGPGLVVEVVPRVGWFVVAGQPVARVWHESGAAVRAATAHDLVADHLLLTPDRYAEQELGVGIRQLVDIANRAAAPSTQDIYTAVQAVHHLSVVLADACRRSFLPLTWQDDAGTVRVVLHRMTFRTHLDVVCDHVRQGGGDRHPRLAVALLRMLQVVVTSTPSPALVEAAVAHGRTVMEHAEQAIPWAEDVAEVRAAWQQLTVDAGVAAAARDGRGGGGGQ